MQKYQHYRKKFAKWNVPNFCYDPNSNFQFIIYEFFLNGTKNSFNYIRNNAGMRIEALKKISDITEFSQIRFFRFDSSYR